MLVLWCCVCVLVLCLCCDVLKLHQSPLWLGLVLSSVRLPTTERKTALDTYFLSEEQGADPNLNVITGVQIE